MNNKRYDIILADPQFLIKATLKDLIHQSEKYFLLGEANTLGELSILLKNTHTDILIIDFKTIGEGGLRFLKELKTNQPEFLILVLTHTVNRNELNELNRVGIKCVISKMADEDIIFEALHALIKNKKYYSEDVLDVLMEGKENSEYVADPVQLTPTEIEIVKLIASGLTTKSIAEQKHVSFHTVVSHRKNIFRKLDIKSASELVVYAMKAGIIDNIDYYI